MDEDFWKPKDADYWKDPNEEALRAVRFMKQCIKEILQTAPRDLLLRVRAHCVSDPRMVGMVAMIDEQLRLRFGLTDVESDLDSPPNR